MYTDFRSAISQVPTVAQLLPIIPEDELTTAVDAEAGGDAEAGAIFEPNPREVLDRLLPRLLETRIYQALLESSASEHSSRMMTMRSATDNATGILDDLTFSYNQARQAGITREISEISAGKAALE
ncbi:MAG: FoF1 ATP synthase subunit gamma, partial [Patescibacteria group bacterium]